MIIVSGRMIIRPGERTAFLAASLNPTEAARRAAGCRDFIVAADPLEDDRVNVYEAWETEDEMSHDNAIRDRVSIRFVLGEEIPERAA